MYLGNIAWLEWTVVESHNNINKMESTSTGETHIRTIENKEPHKMIKIDWHYIEFDKAKLENIKFMQWIDNIYNKERNNNIDKRQCINSIDNHHPNNVEDIAKNGNNILIDNFEGHNLNNNIGGINNVDLLQTTNRHSAKAQLAGNITASARPIDGKHAVS